MASPPIGLSRSRRRARSFLAGEVSALLAIVALLAVWAVLAIPR